MSQWEPREIKIIVLLRDLDMNETQEYLLGQGISISTENQRLSRLEFLQGKIVKVFNQLYYISKEFYNAAFEKK